MEEKPTWKGLPWLWLDDEDGATEDAAPVSPAEAAGVGWRVFGAIILLFLIVVGARWL